MTPIHTQHIGQFNNQNHVLGKMFRNGNSLIPYLWEYKQVPASRITALSWQRGLCNSMKLSKQNPKGNQPWILVGRIDAEAETPGLWSSDANSWLTGKVPDSGKDGGQKEKRVPEDEMAARHYWCNGHELGQTLGDGERQRGLDTVHWVIKSRKWLADWTTMTNRYSQLEIQVGIP